MNIESTTKFLISAVIFIVLGWFEAPITNPPPSNEVLEYQKYYKQQSSKPSLSEEEFAELSRRADEMIKNDNTDINSLLLFKFLFALLLALSAFIITKYLLNVPRKWSGTLTVIACVISIAWFVSSFELAIYIVFCAVGAFLAQKFKN